MNCWIRNKWVVWMLVVGAGLSAQATAIQPATATAATAPLLALQKGDRILVHGDSVTAGGIGFDGFVTLIHRAITDQKPELGVDVCGDGVSGRTAAGLIHGIGRVKAYRPTVVVLYIGLNDVKAKDLSSYRTNVTTLIGHYQDMGARVLLCTPTVRWSAHEKDLDEQLEIHAAAIREIGRQKNLPVVDLRQLFIDRCPPEKRTRQYNPVADGIHLSSLGNQWVAEAILQAFGLPMRDSDLATVFLAVRGVKLPGARWPGRGNIKDVSQRLFAHKGDVISLTAEPAGPEHILHRWVIQAGAEPTTATDNPLKITVISDCTVAAEFAQPEKGK